MISSRVFKLAALMSIALPVVSRAQSSLSMQGFGFTNGQFSTRALGTGGAIAEIDPLSATNPAALSYLGGTVIYFQAEPEYRNLHVGGGSERSSIARYPIVGAAFPVNQQIVIGLTASNFLDRTFSTKERGTAVAGDTVLGVTNEFSSDGAIGDLRLGASYMPQRWVKIGLGVHAIVGDNRIRHNEKFDDSTRFASIIDTATVGYTGNAFSAGVEFLLGTEVSIAGSYRQGGHMSLKRGDTTITTANVPDRLAMSVAYVGIKGTIISARTARDTWTRMRSLGTAELNVTDSWDTSIGADVLGPRIGSNGVNLRTGFRWRTLPFGPPLGLTTADVKEKVFSIGAGTVLGRGGRAALDIATFRSSRTATQNLSETAWTLSVGLTIRP